MGFVELLTGKSRDVEALQDSMEALRELSNKIHIADIAHISGDSVKYDVESGESTGMKLFNDGSVAIQDSIMSKGATFLNHDHNGSAETLIVITGRLRSTRGRITVEAGPGECVFTPALVKYRIVALEETRLIAVTVPAMEGYP